MRNGFCIENHWIERLHYLQDLDLQPRSFDMVIDIFLRTVLHLIKDAIEKFHCYFFITLVPELMEDA
jgi:hypothetical protein